MGYDRGDSFPLDFELNEIPFGSKSKGKLSARSVPIQFDRKWKYSFLNAAISLPVFHSQCFRFPDFSFSDISPRDFSLSRIFSLGNCNLGFFTPTFVEVIPATFRC